MEDERIDRPLVQSEDAAFLRDYAAKHGLREAEALDEAIDLLRVRAITEVNATESNRSLTNGAGEPFARAAEHPIPRRRSLVVAALVVGILGATAATLALGLVFVVVGLFSSTFGILLYVALGLATLGGGLLWFGTTEEDRSTVSYEAAWKLNTFAAVVGAGGILFGVLARVL